ncbi:MAG: hypothetical protein LWY06_13390, partial [Firmicutes bacterium]|nr:hypothetical protein [Bacillota bacterium]
TSFDMIKLLTKKRIKIERIKSYLTDRQWELTTTSGNKTAVFNPQSCSVIINKKDKVKDQVTISLKGADTYCFRFLFFSPDENSLFANYDPHTLAIINMVNSKVYKIFIPNESNIFPEGSLYRFTPDGKYLVFYVFRTYLIIDVDGKRIRTWAKLEEPSRIWGVGFMKKSNKLLFAINNTIQAYKITGNSLKYSSTIIKDDRLYWGAYIDESPDGKNIIVGCNNGTILIFGKH